MIGHRDRAYYMGVVVERSKFVRFLKREDMRDGEVQHRQVLQKRTASLLPPTHTPPVMHMHQFALPFPTADLYAPDLFFPSESNADALAWLEQPQAWPTLRLAVHGDPGTGKTHLLRYFAAHHGATILAAPDILPFATLPDTAALAIDDADTAPHAEALLHLLNAAAENATPVLLAARTAPAHWNFTLPDLVSRLRATPAVALLPPDDDLLRAMLARLLAHRQIAVPERLQEFLLARLPRTGNAMRDAAARLDRYSLAEKRITPAIAQRVIEECENET